MKTYNRNQVIYLNNTLRKGGFEKLAGAEYATEIQFSRAQAERLISRICDVQNVKRVMNGLTAQTKSGADIRLSTVRSDLSRIRSMRVGR
jgi:hypothetical protein